MLTTDGNVVKTGGLSSLQPVVRDLVRFDRSRITYITAFRNAVGVFIPLAVGAATGHLAPGLAASIGALNVAFSDRPGPYRLRAGRMLAVSLLGALSALIGGLAGSLDWLTVVLMAVWGFGGGMLVVFGPAAEQIGLASVVLLIVYGGFGLSPQNVVVQVGFILVGGLFQTILSVLAWPLRQFGPEREALAHAFQKLAAYVRAPSDTGGAPPVTAEISTARTTLTGLGRARSAAAEAFRVLLDEAERIRLELIALHHLRSDMLDDGDAAILATGLDALWTATGDLLDGLGTALAKGEAVARGDELLQQATRATKTMQQAMAGSWKGDPILVEIVGHAEALLGQLRACVDIASWGSAEGFEESARPEAVRPAIPWALDEVSAAVSTLRANLTLRSTSFRHALRLAVTLAIATALARHLGVSRSYWVPMTIAIVLKPDFTSTFTRGLLRVIGTMIGLGLATLLVHLVGGNVAGQIVLIGVLAFAIRSVGPANFGLSAVAISALVVFLISLVGGSPESLVQYRAIDTLLGGLLSMVAFVIWPTWERIRTPALLADVLDAYRRYFDLVMSGYLDPPSLNRAELDGTRLEARLARSNAEASVDRMQSEPATSEKNVDLAQGMLASSHRFAQSAITLEAALYTPTELVVPEGLEKFVQDVDATLEALSAALRLPSPSLGGKLTDLRADQTAMVASLESSGRMGTALLPETERMTNSLNTMVDLVRRCAAEPAAPPSEPSTAREVKHSA